MSLSGPDWIKLNKLLDEALDLEPEQRSRWMDSLPAEYDCLRDTLRDLLVRQDGLETADVLRRAPTLPVEQFAPIASGDLIGPYRLIREIGAGGMATVWLAERADGSLQRQVALKLPRVAWIDRSLAERLNRERDILSALEHPGIARLYDAGMDAAGRPFLALEYVDGVPLDVYARERALTLRQRLDLFAQIAAAIAYAHARLIVHRDLKPTNILIRSDGGVRLLDFGIARLLQGEATAPDAAYQTQVGGRALTPRYAAPEQFAAQPITVATDVYSLGVLLFELLTGVSPYETRGNSLAALEEAVSSRDPRLPSAVSRVMPKRALRGDLDCILGKALRKVPADRYASVEAFAADIERHLDGLPIAARPASRWYRAEKFARRNAVALSSAAAVMTALAIGLGISMWQWQQAAGQRAVAVDRLVETETTLDFAMTLLREVAHGDEKVTLGELLSRSEKIAASADPRTRASATDFVATWYMNFGQYERAEQMLTQTIDALPDGEDFLTVSSLVCLRASVWAQLGRVEEGIAALRHEIERNRHNPAKRVPCLLKRAEVARETSDAPGAIRFANDALRNFESAGRQSAHDKAVILQEMGSAYALNGQSDQAQTYYRQAFHLLQQAGRADSGAAATVLGNWGIAVGYTGNPLRALELHDRVKAIELRLTPDGEVSETVLVNRAQQLKTLARYDEALEGYDAMLGRSTNQTMQAYALNGKADILRLQGDLGQAQALLDAAAAKLREGNVDAGHPGVLRQTLVQAKIWAARGRTADADRGYTDLIDEYTRRDCCPGPQASALLSRAELRVSTDRLDAALADTERALKLAQYQQGQTQHSFVTGKAWFMLGQIQEAQGHAADSRKSYVTAVSHLASTLGNLHPETLLARQALATVSVQPVRADVRNPVTQVSTTP